ncbi:AAA family ATPase [Clostridium formicaceticum]|uniref:AAA family ATPase n=1 Tax=Clostridium formicaceticum TaxID=1497 RepID=A0AAC9WF07_9CLOT|nr:MoxR family ATPase [Clostridium formicaceticum]AOY75877.1 AAA family ATPase [Clostridium formicaceticum]ARE86218.1 ATPase family [Clostridium formicaceticum]
MRRSMAEDFKKIFDSITAEVGKQVVGQKENIQYVLMGIVCGGNILMEGAPGLGKTLLIKTFSRALNLPFSRIQFTPDLMPMDIIGTEIIRNTQEKMEISFEKGPIFSSLILADEINRATPKTQSALLQAMAEKTVTVGKTTYLLEEPFFVLATQNPIEMEGTYHLPEAQLDRFMFKVEMKLPKQKELLDIVDITVGEKTEVEIKEIASKEEIVEMKKLVYSVPVCDEVKNKAITILLNTHPQETQVTEVKDYVRWGCSPRGLQALILGAKAKALTEGRYHVALQDLYDIAPIALDHRLKLNFRGISDRVDGKDVILRILEQVM